MSDSAQVRVVDNTGHTRFNLLLDNGTNVLVFKSGGGFVERATLRPGEQVVPGWLTLAEMDVARDRKWGTSWRQLVGNVARLSDQQDYMSDQ